MDGSYKRAAEIAAGLFNPDDFTSTAKGAEMVLQRHHYAGLATDTVAKSKRLTFRRRFRLCPCPS